jgi:hypothetical protein
VCDYCWMSYKHLFSVISRPLIVFGNHCPYKIGICCFSTKHTALRIESKDWWFNGRIMCPLGETCLPEHLPVLNCNSAMKILYTTRIQLHIKSNWYLPPFFHWGCYLKKFIILTILDLLICKGYHTVTVIRSLRNFYFAKDIDNENAVSD